MNTPTAHDDPKTDDPVAQLAHQTGISTIVLERPSAAEAALKMLHWTLDDNQAAGVYAAADNTVTLPVDALLQILDAVLDQLNEQRNALMQLQSAAAAVIDAGIASRLMWT